MRTIVKVSKALRMISVASDVSGHIYDYIVKLVREYGKYPLDLGEYDIDMEWNIT